MYIVRVPIGKESESRVLLPRDPTFQLHAGVPIKKCSTSRWSLFNFLKLQVDGFVSSSLLL